MRTSTLEAEIERLETRLANSQALVADLQKQRDDALLEARTLRNGIKDYWEPWQKTILRSLNRWRDLAVMWQGKHAILRHENNQLRRKLYRQEKVAK